MVLSISKTDDNHEMELFQEWTAYHEPMKQIVCKFMGHREYSPDILEFQPWRRYRDFSGYGLSDFREPNCLRCGQPLQSEAA